MFHDFFDRTFCKINCGRLLTFKNISCRLYQLFAILQQSTEGNGISQRVLEDEGPGNY